VIEAITDPDVPPLPPHITIEQAQSFAYALLRGDARAGPMIVQSAKQKLEEFLPGR
jgi:pyruvate dehydrogenase (quinone)